MSNYRDPQLNVLQMSGRLARDAELKYSQAGKPIVKGAFAHQAGWGDTKRTEFFNFTWFGALAEKMVDRLKKGRAIIISGRLDMERWDGRDGEAKEKPVIIATNIFLNDWPDDDAPQRPPQSDHNESKSNGYQPQPDDDIPF